MQFAGDQLLGIVDTIAIGSLGAIALAGVTAASAIFIALASIIAGFMSGATIVAAQRIGAHDLDGFGETARAGTAAPLLASIVATIVSFAFSEAMLHGMIGSIASVPQSASYLELRCLSLIPMAIDGTLIGCFGAAGNRALGVRVLAIINLVHIPLLLMLALGWWTHHPLGIVGAGISSLIAETIGAAYAILYVARRPAYRVFAAVRTRLATALHCARLGLPEAVFLAAVMIPDAMLVKIVAPLGVLAIDGLRALNVVSDLTFIVPSPLQTATQIVIGQRLGANDRNGALHFFHRARRIATLIATGVAGAVALLAWPFTYLFTLNPVVAAYAAAPLALHMLTLPLKGYAMLSLAPIRASGDTRFSMWIGLICSFVVIPVAWLTITFAHVGLFAVPIAWIIAWVLRLLLTEWKIRRGDWLLRAPLEA